MLNLRAQPFPWARVCPRRTTNFPDVEDRPCTSSARPAKRPQLPSPSTLPAGRLPRRHQLIVAGQCTSSSRRDGGDDAVGCTAAVFADSSSSNWRDRSSLPRTPRLVGSPATMPSTIRSSCVGGGGSPVVQGRRDGDDAVECTAAAVSSPPFRLGRSSLPRAARHAGSLLRLRFFFPASEGAPRSPDVAATAAGWVPSLVARPRRRRPKRRSQPAMAPVAPDESVDLFIGLRGGLGCSALGWFRGRAERRSVFLLGTANPMVFCFSSSHFDLLLALVVKILDLDLFRN